MSRNVLVVMGSDSDFPVMEACFKTLREFVSLLKRPFAQPTGLRTGPQSLPNPLLQMDLESSLLLQAWRLICQVSWQP